MDVHFIKRERERERVQKSKRNEKKKKIGKKMKEKTDE